MNTNAITLAVIYLWQYLLSGFVFHAMWPVSARRNTMNTDANMANVFKVPAILWFFLYFMDKYTWLANMHAFTVQHNIWII